MTLFRRRRQILPPFRPARPAAVVWLFWVPVLLLFWGAPSVHLADSFLLPQVLSGDANRYQFQTFAGAQVVTAAPLQLPDRISLLLLPGHYSERAWQEVERRARQLAMLENRLNRFRLHVLADGRLSSWETSAATLPHDVAGLRSSSAGADSSQTEPPAAQDERAAGSYQEVGQYLPAPSVPWETLIVIAPEGEIADQELKSYCSAYLADRFGREKVRLVYWRLPSEAPPTDGESEDGGTQDQAAASNGVWATVARSTCGSVIGTVGELSQALLPASCSEIPMPEVALPKGVFQYRARLVDRADGQVVTEFPALSRSLDGGTVSPQDFSRLLQALRNARQAEAQRNGEILQASLREALELNPFHPPTLRFASQVYRRQGELRTALRLMTPLASLMPGDASIFTDIGDLHFNLQEWEQSEQAYRRAINADPDRSAVLAKLIGIREAQGEFSRGLQEIGDALQRFPEDASLHARRGSLLEKSGRVEEAFEAYGRAVEVSPKLGEGYLGLARIHLARDRQDQARAVLQQAAGRIPNDPELQMRYAGFCEKESLDEQALHFYRSACHADPGLPGAYLGLARVQMNLGELDESLATTRKGLQATPRSVELHQLQCELLKQSQRIPEMRRAVETAARTFPGNVEVLARQARVRDVFGYRAAEAYEGLLEALEAEQAPADRLEPVLERGLVVALRDGDRARAARMATRLSQLGRRDIPPIDPIAAPKAKRGSLVVPGGVRGLARAAGLQEDTPAETFVSDFVSHLIRRTYGKAGAGYVQALRYYFDSVAALRTLAKSRKPEFQILLETGNESRLKKTREVLILLGWTIRRSEGRIRVALGTDELAALRQTFSSALGVDEMEMKSQLEAGASYRLTFTDQVVPIIFQERFWLRRFFEGNRPVGGLLRAFAENIASARLYAGLAAMNDEARRLVVETYTSRELLEVYPNSLLAYGSALSAREGRLLLPGGAAAAAAWESLLGVRPDRPKRFVRRLFSQDLGKPMAFYHTLINLPEENQRFLTRSPGRLAKFYAAFPFTGSEEAKRRIVNHRVPFRSMVRELPLDAEGRVRFPGSARVWAVSHGWSGSPEDIQNSAGLAAPVVAPDAEDEILLLLPLDEYQFGMKKYSRVENFLAVVHLERHWTRPMAEESALLLSRNYPKYREIFPYLVSLPKRSTQQLQWFFQAARNIEQVDLASLNDTLGLFHGLLQTLVLLSENRVLEESEIASILDALCQKFADARTNSDFTQAAVAILRHLERALPSPPPPEQTGPSSPLRRNASRLKILAPQPAGIDSQLMAALGGKSREVEFESDGRMAAIDAGSRNRERIEEVLRLQRVPSLTGLLELYDAATAVGGSRDKAVLDTFKRSLGELHTLEQQLENQLTQAQQGNTAFLQKRRTSKWIRQLNAATANGNRSDSLPRLSQELVSQLGGSLKDALVGWVYAYYFSPRDLVVAEDPLLTRKHQFHVTLGSGRRYYWPAASRQTLRRQTGNYLRGALCQIATLTGAIGLVKAEAGESIGTDPVVEGFAAAQLSGVRSLPWSHLNPLTMHVVALKLRLAREFLARSALQQDLQPDLAQVVEGLLGATRRAQLLEAVSKQELEGVFAMLSSSDLYYLGNRLWDQKQAALLGDGPVREALERASALVPPHQDRFFAGSELGNRAYCKRLPPPPYEEFNNALLTHHLSRRLGHLMLTLAESADRSGLPLEALALVAEPAVRHLALNAQMNNSADWRGALRAMSQLPLEELVRQMAQPEPSY